MTESIAFSDNDNSDVDGQCALWSTEVSIFFSSTC